MNWTKIILLVPQALNLLSKMKRFTYKFDAHQECYVSRFNRNARICPQCLVRNRTTVPLQASGYEEGTYECTCGFVAYNQEARERRKRIYQDMGLQ